MEEKASAGGRKKPHGRESFRFFAGLWLADADVVSMTPGEELAYFRLLLFQWREGGLPDDPKRLCAFGRIPRDRWEKVWRTLARKFPRCADGLLRNRKLEEQRPSAAADPVPAAASHPDLADLPLWRADPRLNAEWEQLKTLAAKAYPALDPVAELRAAHLWEVGNAKEARKDKVKFLRNWFRRAQDNPRLRTNAGAPEQRSSEWCFKCGGLLTAGNSNVTPVGVAADGHTTLYERACNDCKKKFGLR